MPGNKLGVQIRSMADGQHIEEEIPNQLEHQPAQSNTDNPARAPDHPTPILDQ